MARPFATAALTGDLTVRISVQFTFEILGPAQSAIASQEWTSIPEHQSPDSDVVLRSKNKRLAALIEREPE